MRSRLLRSAAWAIGLWAVLSLEPTLVRLQAAEIPPALAITEGKTSQGFLYLFGGISSNEREMMEDRAKGYNLKLIFAEKKGPFIAGVTVAIADAKGVEIASVATDGPWFFIQLPAGHYSVKATFKGQTKEVKSLNLVKNKTVQQTFVWDLGEGAEP